MWPGMAHVIPLSGLKLSLKLQRHCLEYCLCLRHTYASASSSTTNHNGVSLPTICLNLIQEELRASPAGAGDCGPEAYS
jgi:hypothetical protein